MKHAIIYCPKHTIGARTKMKNEVVQEFKKRNMDFTLYVSSKEKPVYNLTSLAIAEGCQTLVIVGGDRSLGDTINSILSHPAETIDKLRVGVIPNGTINAFAGFWGLRDRTVSDCIDFIERGNVRKIDAGRIRYTNKDDEKCIRYFLNCINIGLSAHITRVRHNTRSFLWSRRLSFVISTLILLFQRSVYKMRFHLNHETVDGNFMTVCIGNSTGYGQTPSAVPYNGMLDVSAVTITHLSGMIMGLYLLLTGRFLKYQGVMPFRTRHIDFHEVQSNAVSVDGAMISSPKGPFSVDILPEVINFIVPYRK